MHEIAAKHIECMGESLVMTNQRGLFIERGRTLVVADLHLGKTAHFRQHGIAIPSTVMMNDLDRLAALIIHFNARQLVVVGDMFHTSYNSDLDLFPEWRQNFPKLDIILVKGNHDQLPEEQYRKLGINLAVPELHIHPFLLVHDPSFLPEGAFTISAHLHPGKVIYGPARQIMRLPCFILAQNQMVMPAFSLFTGLDTTTVPRETLAYFVLTNKGIFEILDN